MLDLIIRGGEVVSGDRVAKLDIAVRHEKIDNVAEPNTITEDARRVIDASGHIVVPGGIDLHTHLAWPVPAMWAKREGAETQSPEAGTLAAAFGGTTSIIDFAMQSPSNTPLEVVRQRIARFSGHSYIDFGFHCALTGEIPFEALDQIGEVIALGVPSFKIFTTFRHRDPPTRVDTGHLWAAMTEVTKHGGLMVIHSEDDDIVEFMLKKLARDGHTGAELIHMVHNNLSEDISFRTVIRLAEHVGAGVYFVHVTAKEGAIAISEARSQGLPIYGEALHNYLVFSAEDYAKPEGQQYHTYPALKSPRDREALWQGILSGALSTVATDEHTVPKAVKLAGKTVEDVCGGHSGIETRMSVTFSEGVKKRGMSLQRFVELTATNPARIMGMYPKKGIISAGSDADIVLIDPKIHRRLTLNNLHADTDYSIWEGWDLEGYPVMTILRGKVIVEAGEFKGNTEYGQFMKRSISPAVLEQPIC